MTTLMRTGPMGNTMEVKQSAKKKNDSNLELGGTSGTIGSIAIFIRIGKGIGKQKTETPQNL